MPYTIGAFSAGQACGANLDKFLPIPPIEKDGLNLVIPSPFNTVPLSWLYQIIIYKEAVN